MNMSITPDTGKYVHTILFAPGVPEEWRTLEGSIQAYLLKVVYNLYNLYNLDCRETVSGTQS